MAVLVVLAEVSILCLPFNAEADLLDALDIRVRECQPMTGQLNLNRRACVEKCARDLNGMQQR